MMDRDSDDGLGFVLIKICDSKLTPKVNYCMSYPPRIIHACMDNNKSRNIVGACRCENGTSEHVISANGDGRARGHLRVCATGSAGSILPLFSSEGLAHKQHAHFRIHPNQT